MHKLKQLDYIASSAHITPMPFILLVHFGKLKIILRNSGWSAKNKFQFIFNRCWLFFTADKIFCVAAWGSLHIFVAVKAPGHSPPKKCFPNVAQVHLNTISFFLVLDCFFFFGVEKNSTWNWKKIFNTIIISQNEVAECKRLKKQKHCCCQTSVWENCNVE